MSESIERAQEGLESAHYAASREGDHSARWIAVLIAALGPLSDTVLLGYVIALDLIVGGIALAGLGLAARRAA